MQKRILIIDDQPHWLKSYQTWIPPTLAELHVASTPGEASDRLRRFYYNLVVLDLSMDVNNANDRSNREIQQYLSTRPEGTRYVIVSATMTFDELCEAAFVANVSYVVSKQKLDPQLLNQVLDRVLAESSHDQRSFITATRQQWVGDGTNEYQIIFHLQRGAQLLYQILDKIASRFGPVFPHPEFPTLFVTEAGVYGLFWSRARGTAISIVLSRKDTPLEAALAGLRTFGEGGRRRLLNDGKSNVGRIIVHLFEELDIGIEAFSTPFKSFGSVKTDATGEKLPATTAVNDDQRIDFDVYLAYSAPDRPQVETLAQRLKSRGLKVWLDREQIPPGRWFHDIIQAAIPTVRSAAILIGSQGLGKWQALEVRAFVSRCIEEGIPVIPVLLPGVDELPTQFLFLKELHYIRFADQIDDPEAMAALEWGITGVRPALTSKLLDER